MSQVVKMPTPLCRRADAQTLMQKAWAEQNKQERLRLAREALACDERCIDALTLLVSMGQLSSHREPISAMLSAIEQEEAELKACGLYDAHKGAFSSHDRTRIFVRALGVLARLHLKAQQWSAAQSVISKIIVLDQHDAQGLSYTLANLLVRAGEYEAFHELDAKFKHENSVMFLFNRALVAYIEEGRTERVSALAKRALVFNPSVPRYLELGPEAPMPEQQGMTPDTLAWLYTRENGALWSRVPGALRWLQSVVDQMRK